PEQMLGSRSAEEAEALRGVIAGWPTHDGQFAAALARHPTVLAATLHNGSAADDFPLRAGFVFAGDYPAPFLAPFAGFSGNLPAFTEAAQGVGSINWLPERDQVVRRVPLLFRQGDA